MDDLVSIIDEYLARAYSAKILKNGNENDIRNRLLDAFSGISGLYDLAVLKLEQLKTIQSERCFVSNIHRQFLEGVVNARGK